MHYARRQTGRERERGREGERERGRDGAGANADVCARTCMCMCAHVCVGMSIYCRAQLTQAPLLPEVLTVSVSQNQFTEPV